MIIAAVCVGNSSEQNEREGSLSGRFKCEANQLTTIFFFFLLDYLCGVCSQPAGSLGVGGLGGRGRGYEPSAGALKEPPSHFLLHYKADMKQTGSKELTSPADTRAKCPSASPESTPRGTLCRLAGVQNSDPRWCGRKNAARCNRWHGLLRVCRLDQ